MFVDKLSIKPADLLCKYQIVFEIDKRHDLIDEIIFMHDIGIVFQ